MAGKLNIYACSGVGDAPQGKVQMYDYWTDNTNTINNTQAVNSLLVQINLLMAEVEYLIGLTKQDIIDRLNKIDMLVVSLDAAQRYAKHYTQLEKAGKVIGTMLAQGQFRSESIDNSERDKHLDELLVYFEELMQNDVTSSQASDKFTKWWKANVISRNRIGLPSDEREVMEIALRQVKGVGDADWRSDKDLSKYLSDAGTYFLYTYFTQEQLNKLPKENKNKVTAKIAKQRYTYNFCKSKFVGIYGTEAAYKDVIRTGIIGEFGATPEQVCEDIATGQREISGIGLPVKVILAIIAAVVSVVTALIAGICKAVADSNAAKYAALDEKIVNGGVPNEDDFDGLDMENKATTTAGSTSLLPMLIIGGALLFAFVTKKK